jgi:hypothetical protein
MREWTWEDREITIEEREREIRTRKTARVVVIFNRLG